ncbi:GlxA family transcriptional regulator [Roseovarius sp. EL26]|uniref:GlxA family transcriptional regulator n=1 Tax=Roseovarius sp. EL26 TaxID=2126672 RepID=UPI000EA058D9|nr:GlxA family transcriptional regulator [Roseovarius sp. EL26]
MQDWQKMRVEMQTYDVLLFDGFSNHCLANAIEPLRAANMISGRDLYDWRYVTMDGNTTTSSSGLQVTPHAALAETSGTMLLVMPSYGFREITGWSVTSNLRAAASRYDHMAALDTGSWLLARAGLLDGVRATIHWEELESFAETFPEIETVRERYVIDQNRITCSGAMAAFDLVMHLIGRDQGQLLAIEVSQLFMSNRPSGTHSEYRTTRDKFVDRALALMTENLETPLPLRQLAKRAGCTQKSLERRVRSELGTTPQTVYRRLRLNLARKLVIETEQPILEVAYRCGYENASAMTRAFKAEFDCTPRSLRSSP